MKLLCAGIKDIRLIRRVKSGNYSRSGGNCDCGSGSGSGKMNTIIRNRPARSNIVTSSKSESDGKNYSKILFIHLAS